MPDTVLLGADEHKEDTEESTQDVLDRALDQLGGEQEVITPKKQKPKKTGGRSSRRAALMFLLLLCLAGGGAYYYLSSGSAPATEVFQKQYENLKQTVEQYLPVVAEFLGDKEPAEPEPQQVVKKQPSPKKKTEAASPAKTVSKQKPAPAAVPAEKPAAPAEKPVPPAEKPTAPPKADAAPADKVQKPAAVSKEPPDTPPAQKKEQVPAVYYSVHTDSYKNKNNALNEIQRLQGLGFEPFLETVDLPGRGTWHRVKVGKLPSLADAKKLRTELKTRADKNDAIITRKKQQ